MINPATLIVAPVMPTILQPTRSVAVPPTKPRIHRQQKIEPWQKISTKHSVGLKIMSVFLYKYQHGGGTDPLTISQRIINGS